MKLLIELMAAFFKTGLFSIGGGLATLPFLYEMADTTHWFTRNDILDMIAISESTPGAIGINMSTYVGYLTAGPAGAILATLALAAPSVIIILIIARFLKKFKNSPTVKHIFTGLRPASTALIVTAGLGVARLAFFTDGVITISSFRVVSLILALVLLIAMRKFKWHPIVFIAFSAVIGIIFNL